ncbi:hypothetical protein [Streptomyces reniochalinae]|uniref:hypothetical protein n=1 Tax=Streptomyces reniochalinae TaxID=2250578 RepID=UPI0011C05E2D|nr:hypothetical protein [Streptomyces reniochalinae]
MLETETGRGDFQGHEGGGAWGECADTTLRREWDGFEGTRASQVVNLGPGSESDDRATVLLVSMPTERAERYLETKRALHESCPEILLDTEAAPLEEHHEAQEISGLGDEALLEVLWQVGGDEYDGTPSHIVIVRIGGVLAIVSNQGDRDAGDLLAARTTRRVRSELYRADGS